MHDSLTQQFLGDTLLLSDKCILVLCATWLSMFGYHKACYAPLVRIMATCFPLTALIICRNCIDTIEASNCLLFLLLYIVCAWPWFIHLPHTAMKCPDLENLLNGKVNVKKQTLDSTAEYKCKEGFVLTGGDRVRKCLTGGSWSGKAPLCKCKFVLYYYRNYSNSM